MSKQIKAIKCPQCGSSKHTDLGKDHYRCDSCGTEFFLDDNDININIHQGEPETPQMPDMSQMMSSDKASKTRRLIIIILALFFLSLLVRVCTAVAFRPSKVDGSTAAEVQKKITMNIQ